MSFNSKNLYFMCLVTIAIGQCENVFSMGYYGGRRGYFGDDIGFEPYRFERANKEYEKMQASIATLFNQRLQFIRLRGRLAEAQTEAERRQIEEALADLRLTTGCVDEAAFDAQVRRLQDLLTKLAENVDRMATGKRELTKAQMLFRGLAGDDFMYYDLSGIGDSWSDAFKQGMICAASREVSEFVKSKVRAVLQDKLGVLFDGAVNGISDAFEICKEFLFHDGNKPFEEEKLMGWQMFVKSLFDDIEKLVKDGLKDAYNAQDQTMRATDNYDQSGNSQADPNAPAPVSPSVQAWSDLFSGYVMQFTYFIMVLEERKGYYSTDAFEVFFAAQIQDRMRQFCRLLLPIKSIADMDDTLGANKSVISAYKTNIDNLFKQLLQQIKRRTFASASGSQQSPFDRDVKGVAPRKERYAYDDDYQSAWAR